MSDKYQKLTVAFYRPTESFRSIPEHIAVAFESDMTLVACLIGASDDTPENLAETNRYAHLFASAPALQKENERLVGVLESIDGLVQEAMGEWYAISSLYLPIQLLELGRMRDLLEDHKSQLKGSE